MSKVRINDLARELEVKSKQILDALGALGLADGKTHSSSIEAGEAEKVRAHIEGRSRPGSSSGARNEQENRPKIDLSNISKPGDVMKAILARKQEAERQAQFPNRPASPPPAVVVRPPAASGTTPTPSASRPAVAPPRVAPPAEARPEPRKIVPQPRQAPNII